MLEYMTLEVELYKLIIVLYILIAPHFYSGEVTISGVSISMDSILTCISTGGPATTVTWSKGSDENSLLPVSDNTHVSVLVNSTTAQYNHTLNITGTELPAVYECSVSNTKPSSTKAVATIDNDGRKLLLLIQK